jgi:hypothetical protein
MCGRYVGLRFQYGFLTVVFLWPYQLTLWWNLMPVCVYPMNFKWSQVFFVQFKRWWHQMTDLERTKYARAPWRAEIFRPGMPVTSTRLVGPNPAWSGPARPGLCMPVQISARPDVHYPWPTRDSFVSRAAWSQLNVYIRLVWTILYNYKLRPCMEHLTDAIYWPCYCFVRCCSISGLFDQQMMSNQCKR